MQTSYFSKAPTTESFDSAEELRSAMNRNLADDGVMEFTVTMNRTERRRQEQAARREARRAFRQEQRKQRGA